MAAPHRPAERLVVADSFRVRIGSHGAEVRGLQHHVSRFSRSVREASAGEAPGTGNFLSDAAVRIAAFGAGFPRWELWESAPGVYAHRLSLRPLPELLEAVDLVTVGNVRLEHPERKGPNIPVFARINRGCGAEAVLTDTHGSVREGATTSLVWWDGDTLCVSASLERVPSVTEHLVREIAANAGIHTEAADAAPSALHGREVWAVNALHGIRPVTRFDGVTAPGPHLARLAHFRTQLDGTWSPLAELITHP